LDVFEIDAASNRGIDEIRELRENVKYKPARDRYKVFIIDEVHMLTNEAFNALLKTLEEPPEHVVFVLATTEIHKVPATILSRCQQFNFRAIDRQTILARLSEIALQEGIVISESSLNSLIGASEGSMRDAQSLLDQVISFCGKTVEDSRVLDMLGIIPQQLLEEVARAVAAVDARQVIHLVDQIVQSGRNLQQFVRDLLAYFRNLLMIKIAGPDPQLILLPEEDLNRGKDLAENFSEEDLIRFFNILVTTESELRWSSQSRFHLEIGLLKIIQVKRLVPLEQLLAGLQGLGGGDPHRVSGPINPTAPEAPHPRPTLREKDASLPPAPASGGGAAPQGLTAKLKAAVSKVSPMIGSLIDHTLEVKPVESGLEIHFAPHHQFYHDMIQAPENLEVIRGVAGTIMGSPQLINVVLATAPSSEPIKVEESPEVVAKTQLINQVKVETGVKAFLETFQGEITDVKELDGKQ
jgi:DNA polymerase-3 subunit gamma/tau